MLPKLYVCGLMYIIPRFSNTIYPISDGTEQMDRHFNEEEAKSYSMLPTHS